MTSPPKMLQNRAMRSSELENIMVGFVSSEKTGIGFYFKPWKPHKKKSRALLGVPALLCA
ncbi:hypothetical protein [Limnohabitans sp. 2KL-17]|uniref:hypothetical protein n=1 Tax=Limnohabitans sp. 2KL-17 TaxID=1100704 RepID=UPI001E51222C|nr:hypothetical protein [Limnohabitans sp. 2KL-17]